MNVIIIDNQKTDFESLCKFIVKLGFNILEDEHTQINTLIAHFKLFYKTKNDGKKIEIQKIISNLGGIDLCILDYHFPGNLFTGHSLWEDFFKNIPVVFVTGINSSEANNPIFSEKPSLRKYKNWGIDENEIFSKRLLEKINESKKQDCFISYSHSDNSVMIDFKNALTKNCKSIAFWSDHEFKNHLPWKAQIETQLENARIGILLISNTYLDNDRFAYEEFIELTKNKKLIIPILCKTLNNENKVKFTFPFFDNKKTSYGYPQEGYFSLQELFEHHRNTTFETNFFNALVDQINLNLK